MRKILAVGFLVFTSFSVYAKFVYDADSQKVVDAENGWEFRAVKVKNSDNELDLYDGSYSGSSPCSLNLTEITDADGKTYKAVSFKAVPTTAKPYLTEFIAPEVTVIKETAFSSCSVLTIVSVPKIKQISNQAFQYCTSLTTESVNGMMHRGVELLATSATARSVAFGGCTSIEGPLIWNMPQLQTNVVWESMFWSCSNLREVRILSEVTEIRGAAFKDIAPGAAVYMPMKAPAVFGACAISSAKAPYPRVYLKGNHEDWLKAIGEKHHVLPRNMVNDSSWTPASGSQSFGMMRHRMSEDETMCEVKKSGGQITEVTLLDKNILAFVAYNNERFFWVLKMPEQEIPEQEIPEQGFRVIVR